MADASVIQLRLWCDGRGDDVMRDFARGLPGGDAVIPCAAFDLLMRRLLHRARRPLARHAVGCPCVGGDDAAFAHAVALAAAGDREDAALFMLNLVRGSACDCALDAAKRAGLGLASRVGGPVGGWRDGPRAPGGRLR